MCSVDEPYTRQDRGIGNCMAMAAGAADPAYVDRTEDRVLVSRRQCSPLCADAAVRRWPAHQHRCIFADPHGPAVCTCAAAQPEGGRTVHSDLPAGRLSDGARHLTQPGALAQPAAHAGDAAVLDRIPDAHQRVDRPVAGRRLDQHRARAAGSRAAAPALHRYRDVYRHDLYLPAVHGAAALRAAVAARRAIAGRSGRSRRAAVARVPRGYIAAVAARGGRARCSCSSPPRANT